MVHLLLSYQADICVIENDGNTVFHAAAKINNAKIMRILTDQDDSHLNGNNAKNQTPLHLAAQHKNIQIVKYLLSMKVDVLKQDMKGQTSYHVAAENEDESTLQALLKFDRIYVDLPDSSNQTCVHILTKKQNVQMIQLLLKYKANTRIKDIYGNNVYHEATNCNNLVLLQTIANQDSTGLNDKNADDETPLEIAVRQASVEIVEYLLTKRISIDKMKSETFKAILNFNGLFSNQQSCLHIAIKNKNLPLLQTFLKFTTDVGLKDTQGNNPYHTAANSNDVAYIKGTFEARQTTSRQHKCLLPNTVIMCYLLP